MRVVVWCGFVWLGIGFDSIRFRVGLYWALVQVFGLAGGQWDHEDKTETSTLGRGEDAPRRTRRFKGGG